jgi:nucleotide-binding universal stress UspA family protein
MDMKPILVPVDFSKSSENAVRYALHLGKILKTNLYLCHAFLVPTEAVGSHQVAWPLFDYSSLDDFYEEELKKLADKLQICENEKPDTSSFFPAISCSAENGNKTKVINQFANRRKTGFIVIGLSGASAVKLFFMGSLSRSLLESTSKPVLFIPKGLRFKRLKKIAFATDLNAGDIQVINSFIPWVAFFGAELVITHVIDYLHDTVVHRNESDDFLKDIGNKINYDRIYFRTVSGKYIDEGLDWLTQHGQIDMLAVVHHQKGPVAGFFQSSHTKELVRNISLPLMVFPYGVHFTF